MHPVRRFKPGELVREEDVFWNPQTLYHYTTREGLVAILSSGTVWATSIRFLNDASEFTYAQSMFLDKLRGIRERVVEPPHSEELDEAISQLSGLAAHLFVFCLSRHRDLLSQWRAYGQPGNGYSIGFDAPTLDEIIRTKTGIQLAAVSYDPQPLELMDRMEIEAVKRSRHETEDSRAFGNSLCDIFLDVGPIIKDPAFQEEGEWRLVLRLRNAASPQVRHRVGRSVLVPYVPIQLGSKKKPLPVREIVIGPNPHPDLDQEAVEGLCRQCGIKAEVHNSEIPYRVL